MKKWMRILIVALIWCLLGQYTIAASTSDELKGEPKLMVIAVKMDPASLEAGGEATLTITIKNTNGSRYIKNAIFNFSEANSEIIPVGQNSVFVGKLAKGAEFNWSLKIRAIPTAKSGVHTAMIDMSYEDNAHMPHTTSSKIYLDLRQPVRLQFEEPKFPVRVTQGDTPSFSLTLMNLGKSNIYNALLSFEIEGLAHGGSVLVGMIEPGQSKDGTSNFRADSSKTGPVEGVVTLTYEDDFGELYEAKLPLKTIIEQRVVQKLSTPEDQPSAITQRPWLLPMGGIVIVLLIIAMVLGVKRSRQHQRDEARM